MTDHAAQLESTLNKDPVFRAGTIVRPSETRSTPLPSMTAALSPVEEIAQKIAHLEYIEMMELAEELHADGQTVGETPPATAKRLHDWALRKLEKK
jgi:hypothetical protein